MIYLDEILALNFTADYLLLLTTARALGEPLRRKRFALASVLGSAYAAAAAMPVLGWFSAWWMKLISSLVMVRLAFGRSERILRQWMLFLLVSSGFAGVEMALFGFTAVRFPLLLFAGTFLTCYLLLGVSFRGSGRAAVRGLLLPVTVEQGGKRVSLTALLDTGCTLADPRSGEALLIAERRALQPLFEGEIPDSAGGLPFENLSGTGVINVYRVDRLIVGRKRLSNALIGVYEGQFSGNHQALWGGETEGSRSDEGACMAEGMGKATGLAACIARAVHRRERYPAAASHAGGGSGTADETTGGRGAENAHRAESQTGGVHRTAV